MYKKDVVIDADHILFFVTESNIYKSDFKTSKKKKGFVGKVKKNKIDLKPYKKHFKLIIQDYVLTAEVESICYDYELGKTRVILSDWTNFRYDIFPNYKSGRSEKKGVLKKLKAWAMKKYSFVKNCEADEICAYYVKKGGIGFSTDKDIIKGVGGYWFNTHYKHQCWVRTSSKDAKNFMLEQCIAGDATDGIKGIPRIGHIKAKQLLNKFGWSFEGVIKAYESKGLTEKDAVLTYNLVNMEIWTPKIGVVLL